MATDNNIQIICPIRGILNAKKRAKDGLKLSEEAYRVEAIRYLVKKGYPKEHFLIEPILKRFGNNGRNSFRSDFAVLDVPTDSFNTSDIDEVLAHAILICEVKRDNAKSDYVKSTQVKPMLDFAVKDSTVGLYWDNIEQRVFWTEKEDDKKIIKEGPLSYLPVFGSQIKAISLTFNDLQPADSLLETFNRLEDILHQASFSPEKRYDILLKLLLAKIFDEHAFESRPSEKLAIQDFKSQGYTPENAKKFFSEIVKKAVRFYNPHLSKKIGEDFDLKGDTINSLLELLAPIKIIHSSREVVQTFYMKFAKDMYKWDLAQYFTPTTVTDFLVEIANPQFGENIADPACGSADFLVASFRILRKYNPGYADCVWGFDNSPNAVQVAKLNMILNGDGKTNIIGQDSLENVDNYLERFDVITCNPPFGSKILEKRSSILKKYDFGFEWEESDGKLVKTDRLLDKQETGILFVELCVKICRNSGRIAIILPNGYLGNKSHKFRVVREWLLRHTRIAAIISLPRFTFKSSGADVSASVLYLEKRDCPLENFEDDEEYMFAVEMVEKTGWEANKKASPIYKRNIEDGSLITDESCNPILDCDFADVIRRISHSQATNFFSWLPQKDGEDDESWAVSSKVIYKDSDLSIDPKRLCKKFSELRQKISEREFFYLEDIVDFIPEGKTPDGKSVKIKKSECYEYVEIADIGFGTFTSNEYRGWALPSRAKHLAMPGDLYIGSIWGSAIKWCYIPDFTEKTIVTNGCFRCRVKEGQEDYLIDLIAYLNSEGWGVQMRASSRGSDGLAEISEDDAKNVLVPVLSVEQRNDLRPYIENLKTGGATIRSLVKSMIKENKLNYIEPEKRPSHVVLV